MKARLRELGPRFELGLQAFAADVAPLPGIVAPARREAFIRQLVDSVSRVQFIRTISARDVHVSRSDPTSDAFDPVKAAIWHRNHGNLDEAFWLTFLSVHFGKNLRGKWRLVRDIYGKLGGRDRWDWAATSADPQAFREWLDDRSAILGNHLVQRGFGNHRKYESLSGASEHGTGNVVATYVRWVGPLRGHRQMILGAIAEAGTSRKALFDFLFESMNAVARFGRTARFDYLTMLGKLDLAPIEPGSTYMDGATGPYIGSKLLLAGSAAADQRRTVLDALMMQLAELVQVGAQEMEDALCNWQKSPDQYRSFRG